MRFIAGLITALLIGVHPLASAELVMFESPECEWCEIWHEEVGIIYAKTEEAKTAPLVRMDIDNPRNGPLENIRPVVYTPTFVLMQDGHEVGRILGYPGEDFFWAMLGEIVAKIKSPVNACPVIPTTILSSNTAAC
jgi:thioredoxin-related protein